MLFTIVSEPTSGGRATSTAMFFQNSNFFLRGSSHDVRESLLQVATIEGSLLDGMSTLHTTNRSLASPKSGSHFAKRGNGEGGTKKSKLLLQPMYQEIHQEIKKLHYFTDEEIDVSAC